MRLRKEIGDPPYIAIARRAVDLKSERERCACCHRPIRYAWLYKDGADRLFGIGTTCYRIVNDIFVLECKRAQREYEARVRARYYRLLSLREKKRRQEQMQANLRRQRRVVMDWGAARRADEARDRDVNALRRWKQERDFLGDAPSNNHLHVRHKER